MRRIPVGRRHFALVDDRDYDRLSRVRWYRSASRSGREYAVRRGESVAFVGMHRDILDAPAGVEVDHVNGNGLDNRRSNLRLATRQQNAMNKGLNANNTTGFKGVCFDKSRGKYVAAVKVNYRRVHIGRFDTAEDAAVAYDRAARHYHGEYARLNFPVVV